MSQRIKVSTNPEINWKNDLLQFARLLAEAEAAGAIKISKSLCESMDLTKEEVMEVLDRAQHAWDTIKLDTPA